MSPGALLYVFCPLETCMYGSRAPGRSVTAPAARCQVAATHTHNRRQQVNAVHVLLSDSNHCVLLVPHTAASMLVIDACALGTSHGELSQTLARRQQQTQAALEMMNGHITAR